MSNKIQQQLNFLIELDKLKSIIRQSHIVNRSRRENSAEHSWHLAMFALVLSDHAENLDVFHVIKMLLIHDIVEIDAGDAPIHATGIDKAQLEIEEQKAAKRIFGLLPGKHGAELLLVWQEFEAGKTPAARFAKALDRLQPLLLNTLTNGGTWTDHNVNEQQVIDRYGPTISGGSPALWQEAEKLVRRFFSSRHLAEIVPQRD